LNALCALAGSQFFDPDSLSHTLNHCLTHSDIWHLAPKPEPEEYSLPLSRTINRGPRHRLTECGVLEQLESGVITPLDTVGDWYTTSPASRIPAPIRTWVRTAFLEDSEWNQAVMAAPYFPTPGEQEVLDLLPILTDDDLPQICTLSCYRPLACVIYIWLV
jgi:hypothetical protein